jgi:glyoxylase-like metal-dependent hydrolase (beta-lactamase superfamily II)
MLWLPDDGILFSGDVLVEDGVTMVIDGSSRELLAVLDAVEQLHPRVIVPGHGRIASNPQALIDSTRAYITALRAEMRTAVEGGVPMRRALASLPPADENRPVSLASRLRRNANRVYVEMEREVMGLGVDQDSAR